jgi:hypothetical protein
MFVGHSRRPRFLVLAVWAHTCIRSPSTVFKPLPPARVKLHARNGPLRFTALRFADGVAPQAKKTNPKRLPRSAEL